MTASEPAKRKLLIHGHFKTRTTMEQQPNHIFKEEQIDWAWLAKAGIDKERLEKEGNLNQLLQGKETGILSLRLKTTVIELAMDATLRIVKNAEGNPIVEINGINLENQ